jgi:hypothetical protein
VFVYNRSGIDIIFAQRSYPWTDDEHGWVYWAREPRVHRMPEAYTASGDGVTVIFFKKFEMRGDG